MGEADVDKSNKSIKTVTYAGIVVNIVLAVLKVIVGMAAGSIALVADGVHSISDMVTDVAILLGVHFGSRGPDMKHPYGHGRIETFSALFVAIILVLVGAFMVRQASLQMAKISAEDGGKCVLGWEVFAVAILSIVSKELLYRVTRRVAVKTHSTALYANAWHHRSDALSSVAVVIGFVSMALGYVHGDAVAAIAVGLMVILVGAKVIGKCIDEFAEAGADESTVEQITKIIEGHERVHSFHKLRTRSVGREIFLDLHILVDPQLNITEAHEISESLEDSMHDQIAQPMNITVHIEPDLSTLKG
jgi:cation diffusion facilitator family transporter